LFIIETVYFRYRYNDISFEQVLCGRVSCIGGEIQIQHWYNQRRAGKKTFVKDFIMFCHLRT